MGVTCVMWRECAGSNDTWKWLNAKIPSTDAAYAGVICGSSNQAGSELRARRATTRRSPRRRHVCGKAGLRGRGLGAAGRLASLARDVFANVLQVQVHLPRMTAEGRGDRVPPRHKDVRRVTWIHAVRSVRVPDHAASGLLSHLIARRLGVHLHPAHMCGAHGSQRQQETQARIGPRCTPHARPLEKGSALRSLAR